MFSIERDAQLLANRIALLKQEEMKTWKKIEETKRRAQDVVKAKLANEERQRRKAFMMQEEHKRQMQQRAQLQQIRAARNADRDKVGGAIVAHKKEEAKQAKFMAQQHKNRHHVQQEMQRKERLLRNRI